MSAFKDMVRQDLDIILNPDELGELHDIDGKEVVCVFGDMALNESAGGADFAISHSDRTIFAKCEDLPGRKGCGEELMVDGVPYLVKSWSEVMGMAQISLMTDFSM